MSEFRVLFWALGALYFLAVAIRSVQRAGQARKSGGTYVIGTLEGGMMLRGRAVHWRWGYVNAALCVGMMSFFGWKFATLHPRPTFNFSAPPGWTDMTHGNYEQVPQTSRERVRLMARRALFLAVDTRRPERGFPFLIGSAVEGNDLSESNIRRITMEDFENEHVVGKINAIEQRSIDGKPFDRLDIESNGLRGLAYYFHNQGWLGMLLCAAPPGMLADDSPSCDAIAEQNIRANAKP